MLESPGQILRRHGLRPKHSWGQNFLGDEGALRRIVDALRLEPGEPVVELGAGLGHLTSVLLAQGARLTAVERDRDLVEVLRKELLTEQLRVVAANAAEIHFAEVASAPRVAVVGNLPYHLTSPILFSVLSQRSSISRAVFTVQKEVADRLAAAPGSREYGLLSALLGLYFEVEKLFVLKAHLFFPPPKVDSAVIRLTTLPAPRAQVHSDEHFMRVVKACFAQRRKTILNSLTSDPSLGDKEVKRRALERAGIDATRRAETLSPEEFAALERALAESPP